MERLAVLGLLTLPGLIAIAVGTRRNRLGSALGACVLALAALWAATLAAVNTDWRDADGYVDCWPGCSPYQDAVGAILLGSPVVVLVWLGAAGLFVWRRRGGA